MYSKRLAALFLAAVCVAFFASARMAGDPRPAWAAPSRPAPRIVSLIPSLTEDLFAIGAGPQVVGVSQATDYPAAAARLPQVASSASLDAERIVAFHPDLVVGIPAQAALVAPLRRAGLRVALLRDDSFADIFTDLQGLGTLSGHAHEAALLAERLRKRTTALASGVPRHARPRTFVVLGVDPIYTVGRRSYIAQLIALAGGTNAASLDSPYARYSAEALLQAQPDVVVADKNSGFAAVRERLPWSALHAVQDHRAYVLADPDILENPGPRYNDGLAWLIPRLHPGGHSAGYRGR
ncbi:MAG: ABC transporter substrate-binding protein [Candidatus Eremiobacteraeota bacterium]|nr:ABC transporter substrate-binding protein [Candidatus Eremiobacteraeota bacterium]MBC5803881.1 ABC transporter substrate-binding protein [Candidatus Eremiobacteraeota bacterium]MBC5821395.1 ABC transporter substrate-binding protein [Candidatus Eremiobacteraeota bacterium]